MIGDSSEPASRSAFVAFLWAFAGIAAIVVIVYAVDRVWPWLHPSVAASAVSEPGCDLHLGPCDAHFRDGFSVRFGIVPGAIPVIAPLQLNVETGGIEVRAVEVDFAGVDMDMGFNRVPLKEVRPGRYAGQGMLPVCVRDQMRWEARILIHTPQGIRAASFRFDTKR